jgi:hypothetical protein
MLEELQHQGNTGRHLNAHEVKLIRCLLSQTSFSLPDLTQIQVRDMDDAGMGSFYFLRKDKRRESRNGVRPIAERQFGDSDGVPISVALNIDGDGELFELDIWKVDFSPVLSYPVCL